jgi:hypothetical protein
MMDLLKRFEEDSLDDPFATNANGEDDDDEGAGDDDLERRFAGIDLGESSVFFFFLFFFFFDVRPVGF